MRIDRPVYFQRITSGNYVTDNATNSVFGDYREDTVIVVKQWASITDAGIDTLQLVYGDIKKSAKVVRLQTHYNDPFDYIRIDDKRYRVDRQRKLRLKHIFIVSEVQ